MRINIQVDKISRFCKFVGPFTKFNRREYFGKYLFAKLNPREMHTKILSKALKFDRFKKVFKNA